MRNDPEFKDAQGVFEKAIEDGRLSSDSASPYYAGWYMYMGTWDGIDTFKNWETREYLPVASRRGE